VLATSTGRSRRTHGIYGGTRLAECRFQPLRRPSISYDDDDSTAGTVDYQYQCTAVPPTRCARTPRTVRLYLLCPSGQTKLGASSGRRVTCTNPCRGGLLLFGRTRRRRGAVLRWRPSISRFLSVTSRQAVGVQLRRDSTRYVRRRRGHTSDARAGERWFAFRFRPRCRPYVRMSRWPARSAVGAERHDGSAWALVGLHHAKERASAPTATRRAGRTIFN
jgi:hypothetical protein